MFRPISLQIALQWPLLTISNKHSVTHKSLPFKPFFQQYQSIVLKRNITSTTAAASAGILGGIVLSTLQLFIKNRIEQKRETDSLVTSNFSRIFFITNDLQSRLYNILQGAGIKNYKSFNEQDKRDFEEYTSFLFAKFIATINKIENDIMDIRFFQVKPTRSLMKKIQLAKALLADNSDESPLIFYRSQQQLISSDMKSSTSKDHFIDYKEYLKKIKLDDSSLKKCNDSVSDFIRKLADEHHENPKERYLQIQTLQHYLIDIMNTIDPVHLVISEEKCRKFQL